MRPVSSQNQSLSGNRCTVSGLGNVAVYCAEKLLEMGASVLTLSDSDGMIYCSEGFSPDQIQKIKQAKVADPDVRVRSFADVSQSDVVMLAGDHLSTQFFFKNIQSLVAAKLWQPATGLDQ